ncbi:alpha/beta hydrolase [Ktedonosporobacter rubrisoli]|uniref:Alpha/beta hydrolase n=1 Tax=Ktedonosporobacter rubrisoli TaxID=2509675 RepID=A0A4P6JTI9_KTERU|nr:alpha/beta hydrolase [Ktedonosporobacter rubrisoli]QBD78610.1 alpha/beta hydrolase [Ktedonosporobacter rubrisoli]
MSQIAHTSRGPLEYRIVGQGSAVLVLNGGHTNCSSPLGHESFFLDQGYQLIIPSRPGYGRTPSSVGKTAEAFADTLVSFLDSLHPDQVIVVGISAAGPTALQLAGKHPDRVSKLILQNAVTGGKFPTGLTRVFTYLAFNPIAEPWIWAAFRSYGRRAPLAALKSMLRSLSSLPADQVLTKMSPKQQQDALNLLLASRSGSGFLHDIHHRCGDISRITAPTLIIESKYDGAVDSSHATYAAERIANVELFIAPAESHLLWFSPHNVEIEAKMRVFLEA